MEVHCYYCLKYFCLVIAICDGGSVGNGAQIFCTRLTAIAQWVHRLPTPEIFACNTKSINRWTREIFEKPINGSNADDVQIKHKKNNSTIKFGGKQIKRFQKYLQFDPSMAASDYLLRHNRVVNIGKDFLCSAKSSVYF